MSPLHALAHRLCRSALTLAAIAAFSSFGRLRHDKANVSLSFSGSFSNGAKMQSPRKISRSKFQNGFFQSPIKKKSKHSRFYKMNLQVFRIVKILQSCPNVPISGPKMPKSGEPRTTPEEKHVFSFKKLDLWDDIWWIPSFHGPAF